MLTPTNRLLAALPRAERQRVHASGEQVELAFGDILIEPTERMPYVYFPSASYISLVVRIDVSVFMEVGLVGNEGMFGIPVTLGVNISELRAVVQGAGTALRINATTFQSVLNRDGALLGILNRYHHVSQSQLAQAGACTRFHLVEARLARWLLMTADRAHSDSFRITHEFLAYMLGVRRAGVTKAAGSLQRQNLVSYSRGNIEILDRPGLESASCTCYRNEKELYERILPG